MYLYSLVWRTKSDELKKTKTKKQQTCFKFYLSFPQKLEKLTYLCMWKTQTATCLKNKNQNYEQMLLNREKNEKREKVEVLLS